MQEGQTQAACAWSCCGLLLSFAAPSLAQPWRPRRHAVSHQLSTRHSVLP